MSFSCDVNVLLYASDTSSPVHAAARGFLREGRGRRPLLPGVADGHVLSAHRDSPGDLLPASRAGRGAPERRGPRRAADVRLLAEEDGFLGVYREVTGGFPVRGNLVPDAHLAALLKQHGVKTLYTRDTDFRKFPFLEVRDPFAA